VDDFDHRVRVADWTSRHWALALQVIMGVHRSILRRLRDPATFSWGDDTYVSASRCATFRPQAGSKRPKPSWCLGSAPGRRCPAKWCDCLQGQTEKGPAALCHRPKIPTS